jgi:hypothetical protein
MVKNVDGDRLWLPSYKYMMQVSVANQAPGSMRDNLKSAVSDEISRLRRIAKDTYYGSTHKVPGTNTLFVLPNGSKVLYYQDGNELNDTVYYEQETDCKAVTYIRYSKLKFEERNRPDCLYLKSGVPLKGGTNGRYRKFKRIGPQ